MSRILMAVVCGCALLACSSVTPPGEDGGAGGSSGGGTGGGTGGGGEVNPCLNAGRGAFCGDGHVCVDEHCVASVCGDGLADTRTEECDDGNSLTQDGCEAGCTWTCTANDACDDARVCNGAETCNAGPHVCVAGTQAADGTSCSEGTLTNGVCRAGACAPSTCGDGFVMAPEDCDDGNTVADDGCENDCTFTCQLDSDCADGNSCNGEETCDTTVPAAPVCKPGLPWMCVVADSCHSATCNPAEADPLLRCTEALIDADGDGEAPSTLGACGTDCNDANAAVNSAAVEICGNGVDDDCDPVTPDTAQTTYYVDCDLDGFATNATGALTVCEQPTTRPCPGSTGGWTTRLPSGASNIDCDNFNANVRPNQSSYFTTNYTPSGGGAASYDYNCNMTFDRQYGVTASAACELRARTCIPAPCLPDLYCQGTSGWSGSIPACGVSSTYRTCASTPSVCRWNGNVQPGCTLVCDPRSAACCVPGTTGCKVSGTLPDTFCTPGSRGCAITCTPNTTGCIWAYPGCNFANTTRTQACR